MKPLAAAASGDPMMIDKAILLELNERLAEAIASIARGNDRIGGWKQLWRCTDAIMRTGAAPADCPKN